MLILAALADIYDTMYLRGPELKIIAIATLIIVVCAVVPAFSSVRKGEPLSKWRKGIFVPLAFLLFLPRIAYRSPYPVAWGPYFLIALLLTVALVVF